MRTTRDIMGMPVTVEIVDIVPAKTKEQALAKVFEDFVLLDQTFSPFISTSEISLFNSGQISIDETSDLVKKALELGLLYERATDGYFSCWMGKRLDPSGLVKGWAIDRACAILSSYGCRNFFVDAGGDVQTQGFASPDQPWRVGIRHPVQRDKVVCVVLASGLAVATSGIYEKGEHILDPHTQQAVSTWLSLTVVGPDILQADVYATACCARGAEGMDFINRIKGYEAYAIDQSLQATYTSGFKDLCA